LRAKRFDLYQTKHPSIKDGVRDLLQNIKRSSVPNFHPNSLLGNRHTNGQPVTLVPVPRSYRTSAGINQIVMPYSGPATLPKPFFNAFNALLFE
jgi:hypothetical protein